MAFTKVLPAGISSATNLVIDSINSAGIVTATGIVASTGTFSGNVSIAGTLTYEDVTNIDSVGIITAQSGIHVTGGNIGVNNTNPQSQLHVTNASSSTVSLMEDGASGADLVYDGSTNYFSIKTGTGGAGSQTTRLTIQRDNGNIGIGSETPRYGLDVHTNNILVSGSSAGNLILEDRGVGDSDRPFAVLASNDGNFTITNSNRNASGTTTGSVERLRITSTGAVGIGSDFTAIETAGGGGITLDSGGGGGNIGVFLKSTGYTGNQTKLWQDSANAVSYLEATERPLIIKAGDGSGDYLRMDVAGSERLRITSGGNLGINNASPGTKLAIGDGTIDSSNVITFGKRVAGTNSNLPVIGHHSDGSGSGIAICATSSGGKIHFFTGNGSSGFGTDSNAERMRIDHNGNIGIATDSPSTILDISKTVTQNDNNGMLRILNTRVATNSSSNASLIVQNNNVRGQFFAWEASGLRIGSRNALNTGTGDIHITAGNDTVRLSINASTGNFTGSASADISDGRLKENIQDISASDAVNMIKGLQGRTFTWKEEAKMGTDVKYGFIAQEVESILPSLVHQESGINRVSKDVDKQGYGQGEIVDDYSDAYKDDSQSEWSKSVEKTGIIPILVEALKDSISKIESLEARIATLEGS